MGNDLHGLPEEISSSFLFDDRAVYFTGGDIMGSGEFDIKEPLIITKIEIHFAAVPEDEHFTMLCRVHRPRIDIQVGIDLDGSNPVATVLQDTPDRSCGDPFSQSAHHTAGNNDIFHSKLPDCFTFCS